MMASACVSLSVTLCIMALVRCKFIAQACLVSPVWSVVSAISCSAVFAPRRRHLLSVQSMSIHPPSAIDHRRSAINTFAREHRPTDRNVQRPPHALFAKCRLTIAQGRPPDAPKPLSASFPISHLTESCHQNVLISINARGDSFPTNSH